ncbi:MAG: hypothetical protein M9962_06495 [Oligoflexia bacterium]|nr:hypothetical protein [Oligoflexia bacterium]
MRLLFIALFSALVFPIAALSSTNTYKDFFAKNQPIFHKKKQTKQDFETLAEKIREEKYQNDPLFWTELNLNWGENAQRELLPLTLPTLSGASELMSDATKATEIVWIVDPWEKILRPNSNKKDPLEEWQKAFPGELIFLTPFAKLEDRASHLNSLLEKRSNQTKIIISSGLSSLTVKKALDDYPSLTRSGLITWINIDADKSALVKNKSRSLASLKESTRENRNIKEFEENLQSSVEKIDFDSKLNVKIINLFSIERLKNLPINPLFFSGDSWIYQQKNLDPFWLSFKN